MLCAGAGDQRQTACLGCSRSWAPPPPLERGLGDGGGLSIWHSARLHAFGNPNLKKYGVDLVRYFFTIYFFFIIFNCVCVCLSVLGYVSRGSEPTKVTSVSSFWSHLSWVLGTHVLYKSNACSLTLSHLSSPSAR